MIQKLTTKQLKHGDVLHCWSGSWLSRTIRRVTGGGISHTAIVIKLNGTVVIADAQANGVNLRSLQEWQKKYNYEYTIHRRLDRSAEWLNSIDNRVMQKIGVTPYDFAGLIHQLVYNVCGWWVGRRKEKAEARMYCSEFIAWVLQIDRYWKLSPAQLYEVLENSNEYELIS